MRRFKSWLVVLSAVVLLAVGGGVSVSAQSWPPPGSAPAPTTCSLEGVGWIVCPVLRSAAKAADYAFTFISQSFLGLELTLFDSGSGVQQAWRVMWNIANVGFVLALLWVIYGHITGNAAGTYNIKRMLPRMIIGAVLVQVSFYVSQLLVDLSNIVGAAINNILGGIATSIGPSGMPLSTQVGSYDSVTLAGITGGILGNTHVAWVLIAPLSAIVLLSALICAALIVVLIVRKTLVMALVLLSPLAFVAYLLPSTEHLFSRWLKLLLQTLLLFPVVAILLGTGQIVSASILKAGTGAGGYQVQNDDYVHPRETTNSSATLRLVAAGAAVLPLAGTWYAFRAAMSGTESAVARVKRGSQRGSGRRRDDASKREKIAMEMTNKTMMQKGFTRLQQLSNLQDARSGDGLLGGVFGNRRTRKKTPKSPEQTQFENKVQDRLGEMRQEMGSHTPPLSPQALYSRALQHFNDAQGELGADEELSLHSQENIDLKAAEALLLESLARPAAAVTVDVGTGEKEAKESMMQSTPRDASDTTGGSAGSSSQEPPTPQTPSTPTGLPTASIGIATSADEAKGSALSAAAATSHESGPASGSASTSGSPVLNGAPQAIIIQSGAPAAMTGSMQSPTVRALRREKPNDMEILAKARAAKYVAQSHDTLLQDDAEQSTDLLSQKLKADEPTQALQKIEQLAATQQAAAPTEKSDLAHMPSTLRNAEITAARVTQERPAANDLSISHSIEETSPVIKKEM